jgi:hypothetical protein
MTARTRPLGHAEGTARKDRPLPGRAGREPDRGIHGRVPPHSVVHPLTVNLAVRRRRIEADRPGAANAMP